MRERVKMVLLDPCRKALDVADEIHVGLIVPTIICGGISAASTFLNGQSAPGGQDGAYFKSFVLRYMNGSLQNDPGIGGTWADWMYSKLRCGLAHAFTIESGGVETQGPYLVPGSPDPKMNLRLLLDDFENGWNRMLDDVVTTPADQLAKNFVTRFDRVFQD